MKNKKVNPADFLGAKTLSPLDKMKIKGGVKHQQHQQIQCIGQYVVQQQQQQNKDQFLNF